MNVISLKDYAKQNNISYEAVRQQVVRYKDDLAEHIIRDGRQQFLDDEAVAFLDSKRQKNPVAIIQMDKDEQIEALRNEKEALLIKLASVQDELLQEKNKVQALIDEQKGQIALLEADNEAQRVKAAEAEKTIQETRIELEKKEESERSLAKRAEKAESSFSDAKLYAAELEAYLKLPKIVQLFTKRPTLKSTETGTVNEEERQEN